MSELPEERAASDADNTPAKRKAGKKRWLKWLLEGVIIIVIIAGVRGWQQRHMVSGPAPALMGSLMSGSAYMLPANPPKPVLVHFWATWCPICEALVPKVQAARARHGDAVAFVVVAVGVNQNPRSVRRYLEKHPAMGPVLWDGKGNAVRAFEAPGTTYVVALNGDGKVVYTGFGADQDISDAFAKAER